MIARRQFLCCLAGAGSALVTSGCRREPIAPPRAHFAPGALRLELRHEVRSGTARLDLVRMRAEPQWPGRKDRLGEALDWGDYRLSLEDPADGAMVFRTGFDSSLESAATMGATDLAVRLPLPQRTLRAIIERRRTQNVFQSIWEHALDPTDPSIDRSPAAITARVDTLFFNGTPDSKVDLAIVGDGYRESEFTKFLADAKRAASHLFSVEPYAAHQRDFNAYSVFAPSAESGATDGYLGIRRKTAFGSAYGTGEAERTLAVRDHRSLCEAASHVPYDFLLVIVNARRYGGSAYFGGPAVVAIDSAAAKYLVVHEFAHVIGGLADEYYIPTADGPAYSSNVGPWHPNVTTSPADAKWRALGASAAEPQPWNKAEYDRYFADYVRRYFRLREVRAGESAVEKFMAAESARQAALLARNPDPRRVHFFEGANGYSKGVFRSEVNCIMFSLQTDYFCAACTSAIERMIAQHTS